MGRKSRTHVFFSGLSGISFETATTPESSSNVVGTGGTLRRRVTEPSGLGEMLRCSYGSNLDMAEMMMMMI